MKTFTVLSLPAILACAMPAVAQTNQKMACLFTTECVDTDGCTATDYEMTLTYLLKPLGPKGMISRALKSDLAGETRGLMAVRNEMAQYIAGDIFEENEERLLVTETGDARFVVTLPEIPMVITYSGRCEVIE